MASKRRPVRRTSSAGIIRIYSSPATTAAANAFSQDARSHVFASSSFQKLAMSIRFCSTEDGLIGFYSSKDPIKPSNDVLSFFEFSSKNSKNNREKGQYSHFRDHGWSLDYPGGKYLQQQLQDALSAAKSKRRGFLAAGTQEQRDLFLEVFETPNKFVADDVQEKRFCSFVAYLMQLASVLPDKEAARKGLYLFFLHIVWPVRAVAVGQIKELLKDLGLSEPALSCGNGSSYERTWNLREDAAKVVVGHLGGGGILYEGAFQQYFRKKQFLHSKEYRDNKNRVDELMVHVAWRVCDKVGDDIIEDVDHQDETKCKEVLLELAEDGRPRPTLAASKAHLSMAVARRISEIGLNPRSYDLEGPGVDTNDVPKSMLGLNWTFEDVEVIKVIAIGTWGLVLEVCWKANPSLRYAMKMERASFQHVISYLLEDIRISGKCDNRHVNKTLAWKIAENDNDQLQKCLTIATLQMLGGPTMEGMVKDLSIIKAKTDLEIKTIVNFLVQLTSAVKHVHENDAVHLDVKPKNVLSVKVPVRDADGTIARTFDGQPELESIFVLIDFGCGRKDPNNNEHTTMGTANFQGTIQGKAQDVFGVGSTVHLCVTNEPAEDAPIPPLTYEILLQKFKRRFKKASELFVEVLTTIVFHCLVKNEEERWSIQQVHAAALLFKNALHSEDPSELSLMSIVNGEGAFEVFGIIDAQQGEEDDYSGINLEREDADLSSRPRAHLLATPHVDNRSGRRNRQGAVSLSSYVLPAVGVNHPGTPIERMVSFQSESPISTEGQISATFQTPNHPRRSDPEPSPKYADLAAALREEEIQRKLDTKSAVETVIKNGNDVATILSENTGVRDSFQALFDAEFALELAIKNGNGLATVLGENPRYRKEFAMLLSPTFALEAAIEHGKDDVAGSLGEDPHMRNNFQRCLDANFGFETAILQGEELAAAALKEDPEMLESIIRIVESSGPKHSLAATVGRRLASSMSLVIYMVGILGLALYIQYAYIYEDPAVAFWKIKNNVMPGCHCKSLDWTACIATCVWEGPFFLDNEDNIYESFERCNTNIGNSKSIGIGDDSFGKNKVVDDKSELGLFKLFGDYTASAMAAGAAKTTNAVKHLWAQFLDGTSDATTTTKQAKQANLDADAESADLN